MTDELRPRAEGWITKLPPYLNLAILVAISLLIWGRPLLTTFALAAHDDDYTHILLILPVSVALIFLERNFLKPSSRASVAPAVSLLFLAVLMECLSRWQASRLPHDVQLSLSMTALVVWWMGAFVFGYGIRASSRLVFPLCFLFWLVPLPKFVLTGLVVLLQQDSAWASHMLFAAAGVPVMQNGVLLSIPGLTIEVARECSSIRSSLMLVVASTVLAHLFLRSTGRQILFVLAAIPLSIARNGFRIFALALLGIHVDPGFLHGDLHHHGGIVFFVLALAALLLLLWLLRWTEDRQSPVVALQPTRV